MIKTLGLVFSLSLSAQNMLYFGAGVGNSSRFGYEPPTTNLMAGGEFSLGQVLSLNEFDWSPTNKIAYGTVDNFAVQNDLLIRLPHGLLAGPGVKVGRILFRDYRQGYTDVLPIVNFGVETREGLRLVGRFHFPGTNERYHIEEFHADIKYRFKMLRFGFDFGLANFYSKPNPALKWSWQSKYMFYVQYILHHPE